jgi:hypothetical protein
VQRHRDVRQRVAERADGRDHQGPAGPAAQREQAGHDRARPLHRHDRVPDRDAAQVRAALNRPEQHPGRPGDQVEERELDGDHPQPVPRPEAGPALGHVREQDPAPPAARFRLLGPGQLEQAEGKHARQIGRGVGGHHHGGTGEDDQHPAQRRAGDPGHRGGQPVQRVRVAQLMPGDDLHRQRAEGRGEERLPRPFQQGQQDEQPDRGPPGEQRRGQAGLRPAAEHVGAEHHPAPPEPVRDRAGEREQQHLRDHAQAGSC